MVNRIFYKMGIVILLFLVAASILQNTGLVNLTDLLYPCLFHQISGLYCPGCGGTRAVKALIEGHFIDCFFYHPFVFYCAVMYLLFMGSHTIEKIYSLAAKNKSSHKKPFVRGLNFKVSYVYIGIIIILVQWMIKNAIVLFNNY